MSGAFSFSIDYYRKRDKIYCVFYILKLKVCGIGGFYVVIFKKYTQAFRVHLNRDAAGTCGTQTRTEKDINAKYQQADKLTLSGYACANGLLTALIRATATRPPVFPVRLCTCRAKERAVICPVSKAVIYQKAGPS